MAEFRQFYVAKWSCKQDCYIQCGQSMSLENAKGFLKGCRKTFPNKDFVIIAILDI